MNIQKIPLFESFNNDCLIIVDVQKPFEKWWIKNGNPDLVNQINNFCKHFSEVYQIWDDHECDKPSYVFNNEVFALKKTFGVGNPDGEIYDYSEYFDGDTLNDVYELMDSKVLEPMIFKRKDGNYAVLVNGSHKWFLPSKEFVDFLSNINKNIILVGGAEGECLKDIEVLLQLLNKKFYVNREYTYNAHDVSN